MKPIYFATPAKWRTWLRKNHRTTTEVWVGYYKRGTGEPSMSWPESVDEALCFGWIDGVRHRIDDRRYTNRFTPRTSTSTWSVVNVKRAKELIAAGRMTAAGRKAFEARRDDRTAIYSYEQRKSAAFAADQVKQFRRKAKAWAFFQKQAPSYRRAAAHWVISAKREETRAKRLATLIADSAASRHVGPLRRRDGKNGV